MGYISDLATIAGIEVIVALGLYLQMATGQISAGQAAFMGIGAYAAGIVSMRWGFSLAATILSSAVIGGLIGALFAVLVLRLSHWFLAVATLAFGEALVVVAQNVDAFGGPSGFYGIPLRTTLWWVLGVLVIVLYVMSWVQRSRYGHAFRAVNQDENVAAALGIDAKRIRVVCFGAGTALAGVGGALMAQYTGLVQPTDLGFANSLPFLLYVAVGGTYNFWGTVLGTVLLLELPELLRFTLYDRLLLYGILMILVMIIRPQGLLGASRNRLPGHWLSVGRLWVERIINRGLRKGVEI